MINCQTLLKRTFVAVVILGVIFAGIPYIACAVRGSDCSQEGVAARNDIRDYAALVLAAIAKFTNGGGGPTLPPGMNS
jgi:hypothetical protein